MLIDCGNGTSINPAFVVQIAYREMRRRRRPGQWEQTLVITMAQGEEVFISPPAEGEGGPDPAAVEAQVRDYHKGVVAPVPPAEPAQGAT
jgi:hypothetical protein